MRETEMREIGTIINQVIASPEDEDSVHDAKEKALALCGNFGLPY
jgi:glycine/serine hydroxymethyltransferase